MKKEESEEESEDGSVESEKPKIVIKKQPTKAGSKP